MADLTARERWFEGPAEQRAWVGAIWARHGRDPATGRLVDRDTTA
jgi:hypothetical protein